MRNRTIIRLTENDLNNLIAEAATRMINELDKKTLDRSIRRKEEKKKTNKEDGENHRNT